MWGLRHLLAPAGALVAAAAGASGEPTALVLTRSGHSTRFRPASLMVIGGGDVEHFTDGTW
eukprot:COSAG01_NODE_4230_length_5187_cov_2.551913_3_plen_61_part_00